MKYSKIFVLITLTLIVFSSCKSDLFSETDEEISAAISEISQLAEHQNIEYELIGSPSYVANEKNSGTIKLELSDPEKPIEDYETFAKRCAKIIFNASSETKNYSEVWVSLIDNGKKKENKGISISIGINISKEVRNFVFKTSSL